MKIMKVLGVVAGIHLFALVLLFAIPGCNSTSKPSPAPVDTLSKSEPAPVITVPAISPAPGPSITPMASAPLMAFNPDAPAMASSSSSGGGGSRFMPTRPGTAAASTLVAEPVIDVVPAKTYTAKPGDTLTSVAHKNDLTIADLAKANNLGATAKLHDGQKLIIPGKSAAAATAAKGAVVAPKPSAEAVKHTVKSGETLSAIAKTYGVTMGAIAVANNITDPQKIPAGMVLTIPDARWKPIADKNAKSAPKSPPAGSSAKSVTPADNKSVLNGPGASPVPVIGASGGQPDIPVIKVEEAPAEPKKP